MLGATALPVVAGLLRGRPVQAAARSAESPAFLPGGELGRRVRATQQRLVAAGFPTFSEDFVLADVRLDPAIPRLFAEFSGDISGRYLEALALMPPDARASARVRKMAHLAIQSQRSDGRFGNPDLQFDPAQMGKLHIAQLWGNGRLLLGLVTVAKVTSDAEILSAALRLGDFLLRAQSAFKDQGLRDRLAREGAHGLICLTQSIESLVALSVATNEPRFERAATELGPLLPPRGIQHTHGYLTTLRGVMMLSEQSTDPALLKQVQTAWTQLLAGPDLLVTGGVPEFFGAQTRNLSAKDLAMLAALDNKAPQDEGCSEADLVRLGFQLHRRTGDPSVLEATERALLIHLLANQFHTGDFGHRTIFGHGFRPATQVGMAWWCCTMHGLRALHDVRAIGGISF